MSSEKFLKEKVLGVLSFAYGGEHHIPGEIRQPGGAHFIEINVPDGIATFDFDNLTRLVIGCHQICVRMEIVASGPRRLKLRFHNRRPEGRIFERHPTMQGVLEQLWPDALAKSL